MKQGVLPIPSCEKETEPFIILSDQYFRGENNLEQETQVQYTPKEPLNQHTWLENQSQNGKTLKDLQQPINIINEMLPTLQAHETNKMRERMGDLSSTI